MTRPNDSRFLVEIATEDDDRRPSLPHTAGDQQMVTGFDGRRPTPPHTAGDQEMATEDDGPDEFLFEPPRTRYVFSGYCKSNRKFA